MKIILYGAWKAFPALHLSALQIVKMVKYFKNKSSQVGPVSKFSQIQKADDGAYPDNTVMEHESEKYICKFGT
jgi:hypothetical protein